MKIGSLLKCTALMVVLILLLFLVLSLITYFAGSGKIVMNMYNFVAPICVFIVSFIYSMSCGEKGLLRGIEIWVVYFLIICLLKYTIFSQTDINIVKHVLYMPVSIIAGILGVNLHK